MADDTRAIETTREFEERVRADALAGAAVHELDLRASAVDWPRLDLTGTTFLGCTFPSTAVEAMVRERGAQVFPPLLDLPFRPYRSRLYAPDELLEGWTAEVDDSLDLRIYEHFRAGGRFRPRLDEALAERIHDHAIDDALRNLLGFANDGMTERRVVGFMGGHGVARGHADYRRVAETARRVARAGYTVASGGGPGLMEAANLGAYLSGGDEDALERAIAVLTPAPTFRDPGYVELAMRVRRSHSSDVVNIAVPTWFYGHEPTNLFASHVAKYFSNSLREDVLLAVCLYGIVFARGSAGTTQEIFMDAAQNHYGTFGWLSPMVFLGRRRYVEETDLHAVVSDAARGRPYARLIALADTPDEVLDFLTAHPPVRAPLAT